MDRRGFLGTLIAAAVGSQIPSDVLWLPTPSPSMKPLGQNAVVGLVGMTKVVQRLLVADVGGFLGKERNRKVGDLVVRRGLPVTMTDQVSSWIEDVPDAIDHDGLDVDRYLKPLACLLSEQIRARKMNAFGHLPLPNLGTLDYVKAHACTVGAEGISVRGYYAAEYSPLCGDTRTVLRFDVIGGRA